MQCRTNVAAPWRTLAASGRRTLQRRGELGGGAVVPFGGPFHQQLLDVAVRLDGAACERWDEGVRDVAPRA